MASELELTFKRCVRGYLSICGGLTSTSERDLFYHKKVPTWEETQS